MSRTLLRLPSFGWALAAVLCGCQMGGVSYPVPAFPDAPAPPLAPPPAGQALWLSPPATISAGDERAVQAAQFAGPIAESLPAVAPARPSGDRLLPEDLVAEVLTRNPSIRAAHANWQAASQRYPQEVSLEDPMFGFMVGPASWGRRDFDGAYLVEASQKIPWPGKRQLRGEIAQAESMAAFHDISEEELRIAEAARRSYYDYALAHYRLAVLSDSTALLQDFREIAKSKFESAQVGQQDVLLADVELADLERQRLELTRVERVARARINTLLLLEPSSLLPPPAAFVAATPLPPAAELQSLALAQRPDLAAQVARIQAQRAGEVLAEKEFYPDLELVSRYDAFWQEQPLRPMVGMNLNLPLYREKRRAAVSEAGARIAQQQAELDIQIYDLAFEVEQGYQLVQESEQTLRVYQERLLPAAQHSIEAARASYVAGRLDFLRLIEAQRQLLTLQDRYYTAAAEYYQRRAALDRIVGGSERETGLSHK